MRSWFRVYAPFFIGVSVQIVALLLLFQANPAPRNPGFTPLDFALEIGVSLLVALWLFNIHGVRLKTHVYRALYTGFWFFLFGRLLDCLDEVYSLDFGLFVYLEGCAELSGISLISVGLWFWGRENRRMFRDLLAGKEHLEREAVLDQLTGLYNRAYFDQVLPDLISQAHVTERFLSMLVLDIDRFKAVNDTHGHLTGDHVIAALGDVVRATLRDGDPAFRYGGEEMVVLLTDTHLEQALVIAERLRTNFGARRFQSGEQSFRATVSVGVAQLDAADSPRSFFERCDRAMYLAKQSGRDQVAFLRSQNENL